MTDDLDDFDALDDLDELEEYSDDLADISEADAFESERDKAEKEATPEINQDLTQLLSRILEIVQAEIPPIALNIKNHFQQSILYLDSVKNIKNELTNLKQILDFLDQLYPKSPDNSAKQFIDNHADLLKTEYEKLKSTIQCISDPLQAIDQFNETILFDFLENTFTEIILLHKKLHESQKKSEQELMDIHNDMLMLSGIEPIPVHDGKTKFCKDTHDIYEHRSDPGYADGVVIENILQGYRLKRTQKVLKKVGIVLNTRF